MGPGDEATIEVYLSSISRVCTIVFLNHPEAYKKELEMRKNKIEGQCALFIFCLPNVHIQLIVAQISGKNELERLKKQLEAFRLTGQMQDPPEGLKNVIERTLQNYIETSLEASVDAQTIKEQLKDLCEKHSLISSEMLTWVLKEHENIVKKQSPPAAQGMEVAQVAQEVVSPSEVGAPPLSPMVLYHASLVCQAVNTCVSTKSVHEFLKREGHELREVSLSLPNDEIDRYLVAKNGDIIYVAFRSKPALKSWLSQHKSFEEGDIYYNINSSALHVHVHITGLKNQTQKIPLRFFIEQLLRKNKIVFTGVCVYILHVYNTEIGHCVIIIGFSYGGMLACCVTSYLWRAGFLLSIALLQKNVTCITFGQPLINIPYVSNTILRFPELEETIHLILDKQDKVPGLLHYLQVGCILKAAKQGKDIALDRIHITVSMSIDISTSTVVGNVHGM